eukprot:604601-Rhodomonas_salina.2
MWYCDPARFYAMSGTDLGDAVTTRRGVYPHTLAFLSILRELIPRVRYFDAMSPGTSLRV